MSVHEEAARLAEEHGGVWGECPQYPKEDWRHEVAEDNTVLGYWDWVAHQIEADQLEAEAYADEDL